MEIGIQYFPPPPLVDIHNLQVAGQLISLRKTTQECQKTVPGNHTTLFLHLSIIGAHCARPTLVVKQEIVYIYIYMFGTSVFRICTSCHICAQCSISTLHVDDCCSRAKTSRTERLNSGNQCNRDLKTMRKGRHN